jgi:hypothetical protein
MYFCRIYRANKIAFGKFDKEKELSFKLTFESHDSFLDFYSKDFQDIISYYKQNLICVPYYYVDYDLSDEEMNILNSIYFQYKELL